MNEQHSEEEYREKLAQMDLGKRSKFINAKNYFLKWAKESLPHRCNRNFNTENCSGNYVINGRNSFECFDSYEIQDCAHCTWIFNSHDIMDVYGMGYGEWVLDCLGVEKVNNCAFCTFVSHSSDCFYSDICFNSSYLFGCVGLRNKKYCILNKQYSEEEYKKLKARIIEHMKSTGEWGQFFPVNLSPFAYSETAAADYYPLDKEEVLRQGFLWKDKQDNECMPQTCELADDIKDIGQEIVNETLACDVCSKNYKILGNELTYYKKKGIGAPNKCPYCRYKERFNARNPRRIWDRKCSKCEKDIQTTYSPDRDEEVCCEECYAELID